ncbi:MAG: aspartyl/asparaginyl beta-hydroxylase domain-containing protein, partial [Planctomycetota bacterium]
DHRIGLGPWHPDTKPTALPTVTLECYPCARTRVSPMYPGRTLVFPLVSRELADHLGADLERHRERCPRTSELLRSLPGIVEGGFSRLDPGTHIYPHAEAADSAHVRCHLGIVIPAGAAIRIDGTIHVWKPGACLVFDGHRLHEAANEGAEPRTILLCDYDPNSIADLEVTR